jgi:hypothetical protein
MSAKDFFNNKFRKKAKTVQWEIMDIRSYSMANTEAILMRLRDLKVINMSFATMYTINVSRSFV